MTGLALAIALGAPHAQGAGDGNRGGMAQQDMRGNMQHFMPGMMQGGMRGIRGMDPADMAERFAETDADGDGRLSRDEMVARMTERAAERIETRADRMIARMDGDGDGMVTLDEMQSRMGGRMFERLDADGDGAISPGEFARMREMRERHHGKRRGRHDGQNHGKHHGKRVGNGQGHVTIHHHHHYGD